MRAIDFHVHLPTPDWMDGSMAGYIEPAEAYFRSPAQRGSLDDRPKNARGFYAVLAVAVGVGLLLDFGGFDAVAMLFWSAVVNGVLAPPLIVLVVLLTSDPKVMGTRVNGRLLRLLGWTTAVVMAVAAAVMMLTTIVQPA